MIRDEYPETECCSDQEVEELVKQRLKITYIGHSLGGMVLPIYVIHSNAIGKPHHLSQAVLLSPAGFHSKGRVTPYMHYIGLAFYKVFPLFFDHFALPDFMITIISKAMQDILA